MTTGTEVEANVREILKDPDNGRPVFTQEEVRQAVNRLTPMIALRLGIGNAWVRPLVTLATGDSDYTLPGTQEYLNIQNAVLHTDQKPITKMSVDWIVKERNNGLAQGRPLTYALRPESDQTVTLMISTSPIVAEDIDALVSLVPTRWLKGDSPAPDIAFSASAAIALELRVAASLAGGAGPEKLNALAIPEKSVQLWMAEAKELLDLEHGRIITLKRASGPYNSAWHYNWRFS